MGAVINDHEYCRPVTLSNLRGDLTLSSRIFQPLPIKSKKKKKGEIFMNAEQDLRVQALKNMAMLEDFKRREHEISIEEQFLKSRSTKFFEPAKTSTS